MTLSKAATATSNDGLPTWHQSRGSERGQISKAVGRQMDTSSSSLFARRCICLRWAVGGNIWLIKLLPNIVPNTGRLLTLLANLPDPPAIYHDPQSAAAHVEVSTDRILIISHMDEENQTNFAVFQSLERHMAELEGKPTPLTRSRCSTMIVTLQGIDAKLASILARYWEQMENEGTQAAITLHDIDSVTGRSRSVISHLYNLSAAIYTLPNEVLLLIFEHFVRFAITWKEKMYHSVSLTHVTRRWRTIMLNTPLFWTFIELCAPRKFVELLLQRSYGCYLEVSWDPVNRERQYHEHLSFASLHVHRWRRFNVVSDSFGDVERVMVSIRDLHASSLTHLDVFCNDWSEESNGLYSASHMGSAPVMSNLRLRYNIRIPSLPGLRTITTLILYHLDMEHSPFHCFFDLLKSLPSLVNLELDGEIWTCDVTSSLPIVSIPSLLSLKISLNIPAWRRAYLPRSPSIFIARLSESLIIPSLERLAISDMTENMFSRFAESLPLYPLRYPNLKTFETSGLPGNELLTLRLIRALPSIHHLVLSGTRGSEIMSALHTLVIPDGGTPEDHTMVHMESMWPYLHTITINSACDAGVLLHFVESRATRRTPIMKIRLHEYDDPYIVYRNLDWRKLRERVDLELISGQDL